MVKPLGKQLKGIDLFRRRHHHGRRPGRLDSGCARPGPASQCDRRSAGSFACWTRPRPSRAATSGRHCCSSMPAPVRAWPFPCPWWRGWRNSPAPKSKLPARRKSCNIAARFYRSSGVSKYITALPAVERRHDGHHAGGGLFRTRPQRGIGGRARSTISCRKPSPSSATCRGNGIFGSAVIQDRVTDLLDVPAIIRRRHDPAFYRADATATASTTSTPLTYE